MELPVFSAYRGGNGDDVEALGSIAANCAKSHGYTKSICQQDYEPPKMYFRFNAGQQVGPDNWAPIPNLDDYEQMHSFEAFTIKYLLGETDKISQCAHSLTPT